MDTRNGGDLLCSQEGVHPVPRLGRREGGAGHGRCPVEVGWSDPPDPLRVPAGRDDKEEQGGARALLPEDLPPVVGTLGPGEGGGQVRAGPATGRVRDQWEGGAPGGLPEERLAHDDVRGVGLVLSYNGLVGRGWVGVSSASSTNSMISPTSISSSGGCRRWSAASSSDTPPGYVARAWFRYGAAFPGQRVLRACSRAGVLLWRDVADPAPVSRRASPMDRGRPDRSDVRHFIQCPYRAASGPMSPCRTAFTIRRIAGSSAGAPAPFRARKAGRAASLRKVLALPAGLCWAAACASCASVTASATKPRTAASCAPRRALVCSGPFPFRRGMVLRALQTRRRAGIRARTRATGARRTWDPAGARGSTGGRLPRGRRGRVRGCSRPRCAGAKPPPPCACAGPRAVQARGTRPPGSTARMCWRPSALQRIPCRIPRRGGRCVGGWRPATSLRDSRARGRPTVGEGGPGALVGGRGRGAGSPCRASSAGPSARCHREGSRGRGRRR